MSWVFHKFCVYKLPSQNVLTASMWHW